MKYLAGELEKLFSLPVRVVNGNLESIAKSTPSRSGIFIPRQKELEEIFPDVATIPTIVLTERDLFDIDPECEQPSWLYGDVNGNVQTTSTRRIRTWDGSPSEEIEVPEDFYLKRILSTVIHEMGHDIVKGKHFKEALSVNAKTGEEYPLGPHCDDPRCVMYEVIAIRSPDPEDSYMILREELPDGSVRDEKRFDAGNDDQLERMHEDWFCKRCREAIEIGDNYRLT